MKLNFPLHEIQNSPIVFPEIVLGDTKSDYPKLKDKDFAELKKDGFLSPGNVRHYEKAIWALAAPYHTLSTTVDPSVEEHKKNIDTLRGMIAVVSKFANLMTGSGQFMNLVKRVPFGEGEDATQDLLSERVKIPGDADHRFTLIRPYEFHLDKGAVKKVDIEVSPRTLGTEVDLRFRVVRDDFYEEDHSNRVRAVTLNARDSSLGTKYGHLTLNLAQEHGPGLSMSHETLSTKNISFA